MARSFKLPDLGEGIHEGEVLAVRVAVGDAVSEDDIILEVETDKAAVEIPSPYTAKVEEIRVQTGDVVKVGDVLLLFSGEGDAEAPAAPVSPEAPPKREGQKKPQVAVPETPASLEPTDRPASPSRTGPVPASPATRRLARELGIDLVRVSPSGPAGLVTADDVRRVAQEGIPPATAPEIPTAAPAGSAAPPPQAAPPELPDFNKWGPTEQIPFRSIRRATARQMALSWSQVPHVSTQNRADITRLEEFRRKHKAQVAKKGGRLTLTVFALKAVVTALKMHPRFNATLDLDRQEIILKRHYHLGVAVDTEEGLIVPVVRDVDRKSITELAVELSDLVERAHQRKITLEELQGGTFTITNVGAGGGGSFSPIINFPQAAILGMGAAGLQPVVVENPRSRPEIVPRLILPLVLAFDHRVLDGGDGTRFMRVVIDALEDPEELLLTMV